MNRTAIGIIALVLLVGGAGLLIWPLDWDGNQALTAACLRVGIVMGAIWLAMPQLARLPGWLIQAVVVVAVVCAYRPRLALFAVPLLLAYLALVHIPLSRRR